MDLIGQSVTKAIQTTKLEMQPVHTPPHKEIPEAPGLPLLRNTIDMARDLRSFLVKQYRNLGPIFSIRAFNHRFIVLAGPEANNFVSKGNKYFRSHEVWASFNADLGVSNSLISIDGPEHIRMRRDHAHVYSRNLIADRIEDAFRIVQRETTEWPQNKSFGALRACQRIIAEQIGYMATGASSRDHIDDIIYFSSKMLSMHLSRHIPKQVRFLPRFRRSRKRVEEFLQKILADHNPEKRRDKPRDFVDDLLELNLKDPYYISEANFRVFLLAPYVAGLDTAASTCAFMLYELLKNPDILEQTVAEADTLFAGGMPSMKNLSQLDVIHRVAMETLRLYPLTTTTSRTVANSFEFEGYTVPAGATVLVAFGVSHFMSEYFSNPQSFDIERYTPERAEHRQRGCYAPFGVGAHRCLGSSLAEVLIALNIASIVHTTELVLDPPDYKLKTKQLPGLHPHSSLKFRIVHRRK
jgi:cytochrome P450